MLDADLDRALRELAARQHSVVSRHQARLIGCNYAAFRRRAESTDWDAMSERVLRLVGSQATYHQRCMAASLDATAAVSHQAAAALWEIPGFRPPRTVSVTRLRGGRGEPTLLAYVCEPRKLLPHHCTELFGIPVTTVARTIFDLAGVLHPGRTERALDNAIARRITTIAALRGVVHELARRGRPGSTLMRELLATRADDYKAPESGLERRFLEILEAAALPLPERQRNLGGEEWAGRVDFLLRSRRVVFEIDSWIHHWSKLDREADKQRDERLRAAGLHVVHIDEDQVWGSPAEVVATYRRAITPNWHRNSGDDHADFGASSEGTAREAPAEGQLSA